MATGVPAALQAAVIEKLQTPGSDALAHLQIDVCADGGTRLTASHALAARADVYVVDHLWTFQPMAARGQLAADPALLQRVAAAMGVAASVDAVLSELWRFAEPNTDGTWSVLDAVGCAIGHSEQPSAVLTPLQCADEWVSVLWLARAVAPGEAITRDFLPDAGRCGYREVRLQLRLAPRRFPADCCMDALWSFRKSILDAAAAPKAAPPAGAEPQPLPQPVVRVFTEQATVREDLTRADFALVDRMEDADVLWSIEAVQRLGGVTEGKVVNQFPYEGAIVLKDNLALTVWCMHGLADFLPTTYVLDRALPALIGDYQERASQQRDNTWILKPVDQARSIGAFVTDDLRAIVRAADTPSRRYVCQKYALRPVLYQGRKFDMRYFVMVQSFQPFRVFVYRRFWVRLANHAYSQDPASFSDHEAHLTAMFCVADDMEIVRWHQVIDELGATGVDWPTTERRIHEAIRDVFYAASVQHDMRKEQARALYGVDVLLETAPTGDDPLVRILEVTFQPDAAKFSRHVHPPFWNDVFGCLFRNELLDEVSIVPLHQPEAP